MAQTLPQIRRKPVPRGTDEYEARRAKIIQDLNNSIPKEYYLEQALVDNPPLDVTSVPRSSGILTDTEIEITEGHDATSLLKAIAVRKYTAAAVTTAFCKRAAIAHQLTCCLADFFQDEALDQARFLDKYLEENGKPIGPLHGLPISAKAHMAIAGHLADWGTLKSLKETPSDSLTIKILRSAGAIFYVKTNQPQCIMHLESDSFYGRTLNPYNIDLSSGGSSGGEAALNALRGSVLGLGTDIGGSIRGPAGFCNIHGFKPTSLMLSNDGFITEPFASELNILATGGPMCRTLRDADLFMRVMRGANQHLYDPSIIRTPWTGLATDIRTPIRLGIMHHDDSITPHPPVTRALNWARSTILSSPLASKFTLKPFTPHNSATANTLIHQMYWPDSAEHVRSALVATGEPEHPLTTWGLRNIHPDRELTTSELSQLRWKRDGFRKAFIENWNAQDVDFVLCPVFVGPASEHDTARYWNYTALWNFVDYPGIVIPTPIKVKSKKEEDSYDEAKQPVLSEDDREVRKMWEEGHFEGAPIGLQIVARKWWDNELMAVVGALEEALGYRPRPSGEEVPLLEW